MTHPLEHTRGKGKQYEALKQAAWAALIEGKRVLVVVPNGTTDERVRNRLKAFPGGDLVEVRIVQ